MQLTIRIWYYLFFNPGTDWGNKIFHDCLFLDGDIYQLLFEKQSMFYDHGWNIYISTLLTPLTTLWFQFINYILVLKLAHEIGIEIIS